MTITRNTDGSFSAAQRTPNGRLCVAEGPTPGAALHDCAALVLRSAGHRRAGITRTRDCPSCERTGLLPFSGGTSAVACPTCKGRGEVRR